MTIKCLSLNKIETGYIIPVTEENVALILSKFLTKKGGWQSQVTLTNLGYKDGSWQGLSFNARAEILIPSGSYVMFKNELPTFNEDTFETFVIFENKRSFIQDYVLLVENKDISFDVKLYSEAAMQKFITSLGLTKSKMDELWEELSLENEVFKWLLSHNISWIDFPTISLENLNIKEILLRKEKENRKDLDAKINALKNTIKECTKRIATLEYEYIEEQRMLQEKRKEQKSLQSLITKLYRGDYLTQLEIKELLVTFPYECEDNDGYLSTIKGVIKLTPDYFETEETFRGNEVYYSQPFRVYKKIFETTSTVHFSAAADISEPIGLNMIIPFVYEVKERN